MSQPLIVEAGHSVDIDAERLLDTIRLLRAAVGKDVPDEFVRFVQSSTRAERQLWARRLAVNGALALEQVFAETIVLMEFFDALTTRFGNLSAEVRAAITWIGAGTLQEWRPDIDTVESPEALVFRTTAQQLRRLGYHCARLEGQLRERFEQVPSADVLTRIHAADIEQLKEWRVRAQTANSLEAVFAS